MRTCVVAVMTVTLGAGLSACSSDDGSEPSVPDVCAAADAFRGSLTELRDVQVVQEGTDALDSAWTSVEDAWTGLAEDARAEYGDQVDGVQASADDVRTALDDAQDQRSAQTLGNAATAVGVFLQDADALADEVDSTC
jgi:hypothetical protein